ncbi:dihydrolipoamide acetyltransferase family protein [Flavihumibacter petaseus]|uniref:Dihydrolipoamide acetyltransferase component of pyruvate dehydrogenase complex n=1 Tax=Flavihumibacter petaseus NBRC 106054 TaxID=1220578 RepID=A0A0E9N2P4_9BACT|nr:dihydrolipoamide acetyltransferase family protein [Flavihumibacter petaseus]GAO44277.1 dihydrolipoamide acyltransferase [Flavihumibacter petaseus NBRC 106054]
MAIVDLVMPKMGESIMEATILKWLKNPGDVVKLEESVLEIATDKVDSEVPSTAAGILEEQLFSVDAVVPVGAVIARIRTAVGENTGSTSPVTSPQPAKDPSPVYTQPAESSNMSATTALPASPGAPAALSGNGNRFYSPLVLNIANSEGVSMSELEHITGTGNEGRVTKKDILQFVENRKSGLPSPVTAPTPATTVPAVTPPPAPVEKADTSLTPAPSVTGTATTGNVEIIEMDRMRRLIADHMVKSKHVSPHVTSFSEADVTNLVLWRDRVKDKFFKQEGTKITFTPLFIEAIVRCIKKYPLVNSSLDGNQIIIKKDINIGMATALPTGNLIVPVIKNADQLNLVGLARQVNNLADSARNNKLKPEDTQGGTFTLTNVGTFGSLMGTPIINQPQVAILAVGAIKKRPVVIETAQGDSIAIRHMMYLSMSYDHRIVDGSLGATFLSAVARELEQFDPEKQF